MFIDIFLSLVFFNNFLSFQREGQPAYLGPHVEKGNNIFIIV